MRKIILMAMVFVLFGFCSVDNNAGAVTYKETSMNVTRDLIPKPPREFLAEGKWWPVLIAGPTSIVLFVYQTEYLGKLNHYRGIIIYESEDQYQIIGGVYNRKYVNKSELTDVFVLRAKERE